jgi:crossover junction endodeoxyribonuclease RusA
VKSVTVTLPVPGSANTNWRMGNGRMYKAASSRSYRALVAPICRKALRTPFTKPVSVQVIWYRARKSGDLDNRLKVLLDSIQGMLYTDDSLIYYIEAERRDDPDHPRMVVIVEEAA